MTNQHQDFVGVYDNSFTPAFCQGMIRYFEDMDSAGLTINRQQHDGVAKPYKDDDAHYIDEDSIGLDSTRQYARQFTDVLWNHCYQRYGSEYGILKVSNNLQCYQMKLQRTRIGGGYHSWHFESGTRGTGARILTFITYLNTVESGGETELLYYPRRISAVEGRTVIFPGAFTHTHRGNPPLSNIKYIITGWIELVN